MSDKTMSKLGEGALKSLNIHGDSSDLFVEDGALYGKVSIALTGDVTELCGIIATGVVPLRGNLAGVTGNITDVHGDVTNISGNVSNLRGDVSALRGDVSELEGYVSSGVRGDGTGLRGDVTGLGGNIKDFLENQGDN